MMEKNNEGHHIAGQTELNQRARYAVSPGHPETTTLDSRQAYDFGTEEAARFWCGKHPDYSYIYTWST